MIRIKSKHACPVCGGSMTILLAAGKSSVDVEKFRAFIDCDGQNGCKLSSININAKIELDDYAIIELGEIDDELFIKALEVGAKLVETSEGE